MNYQQPCPTCGRHLLICVEHLGRTVCCSHCGRRLVAHDTALGMPEKEVIQDDPLMDRVEEMLDL